jgi:hemoglobin/transferrin/lactoferrin receptor protein
MISMLLVLTSLCSAETFTGIVTSTETGKPLPSATVSLDGASYRTQTDEDGRFELKNITGPASVTVSHVGYASQAGLALTSGQAVRIALTPSPSVLNTLVVTANRYENEAFKVSQPISAAGSAQIAAKGHTIVSDIIRDFPGLDMNDAGPFRSRPVIRGLLGTRVLVLVDGERLNDQRDVTDFAGVSMSLIDPNEIERVEVVNGPSSVLYGSDAMAGVINIITKKQQFSGRPTPFGSYAGRYSTADEQHSNRFDLGVAGPTYSLSVGYLYREANSDFKPPQNWQYEDDRYSVFDPSFYDSLNSARNTTFDTKRLANSRARVNNYDARLAYKLSNKHRVDLDFGAFRGRDIGYPGVPNRATPYLFFYPQHDRDNFSLTYTGAGLTDRMVKMEAKLYYEKMEKDFMTDWYGNVSYPIFAGPTAWTNTFLVSHTYTEIEKLGFNFQELYQLRRNVTATFGFDALREHIDGRNTRTDRMVQGFPFPTPGGRDSINVIESATVPENTWYALGVYASGEWLYHKTTFTGGLRLDNFWVSTEATPGYVDDDDKPLPTEDESDSALNGSFGAVYPLKSGVNAVMNFGTAYRVPNVVERFYWGSASGRETRPNTDIKPERSYTLDAGIKGIKPKVNYSFIGFLSFYKDFTQLQNFETLPASHPGGDVTRLWRYENVEDVTIYGLEAMVEISSDMGVYSNLGLSYQRGQNDTDDQPLFVSPMKFTGTLGYAHDKHGLFGETTMRLVGSQGRVPDIAALDDIPTSSFAVVGATVGAEIYRGVRLALTGNNLLDRVYSEPFNARNPDNPIPEPGRSFTISLNSSF